MVEVFFSRSRAARHAQRKGLRSFRTYRPVDSDRNCWTFKEQPMGPGVEYGEQFASERDWVHHVEMSDDVRPVLVVTCFREEIIEKIPDLFIIEPITPELWAANVRYYPSPTERTASAGEGRKAKPQEGTFVAREKSTGVSPVKTVWRICGENPTADRKTIIAACVAEGVHPSTAATQYSKWRRSQQNA